MAYEYKLFNIKASTKDIMERELEEVIAYAVTLSLCVESKASHNYL